MIEIGKFKIRYIYLVIAAIVIGTLAFGLSYAFLTGTSEKPNKFNVGENDIEIEETVEYPRLLEPGTIVKKNPQVVNNGNDDACVRVRVLFSSSDAEKICEPLVINSNWTYSNGWYYYKTAVKSGAKTSAIFTQVKIRSNVAQSDIIDFEVIVSAESVNARKNIACVDAF